MRETQRRRAAYLAALEEYAAAVTVAGAPLPRRIVEELKLYRTLGTTT